MSASVPAAVRLNDGANSSDFLIVPRLTASDATPPVWPDLGTTLLCLAVLRSSRLRGTSTVAALLTQAVVDTTLAQWQGTYRSGYATLHSMRLPYPDSSASCNAEGLVTTLRLVCAAPGRSAKSVLAASPSVGGSQPVETPWCLLRPVQRRRDRECVARNRCSRR